MTYPPPPVVHPARRARYWVHAVPAIAVIAVLAIATIAGAEAFNVANSDSGSRPAAPFQAVFVWAMWFLPLAAVGTFLTLLAYLVVLPARSRSLRTAQIVLTSVAAGFALITVSLVLQLLPR